jgi:biotin transport system substrate-specific component
MTTTREHLKSTFEMVLAALLVALIIISAKITVPFIIPITLQSLVVILAGMLLGPRRAWLPPLLYLVMGLAGLPVFAKGGGIAYIAMPSFGFIIGFIPGAWVAGLVSRVRLFRPEAVRCFVAGIAGIVVIYFCGFAYIPLVEAFYGSKAVFWATILANLPLMLLGDLLKVIAATVIAPLLIRELEHVRAGM